MGRRRVVAASLLLAAALLCPPFCSVACASVLSTQEAAGGAETVYVAGNPDWYPVEYYDPDSQRYEGILPKLLERISQETGLTFTYIRAGAEDQRQRLAQNGQVELVSGCAASETWIHGLGMTVGKTVLTIPGEDGAEKVCFVFTGIAGDGLTGTVETALEKLSSQEIVGVAVRFMMEHPETNNLGWVIGLSAVAVLLTIALAVTTVKLRRWKKSVRQDERLDPLTGLWNKAYFTEYFEQYIPDQYRNLYCVIYLGFDIVRVNQYYGETAAEEQLCFAANELSLSSGDNEIAARISGGGFAVARPSSGEPEIKVWTEHLLERLNRYTDRYGKDFRPEFRAGAYMLRSDDRDCEAALFNARQGYRKAVDGDLPCAFAHSEQLKMEKERLQLKKQTLDALQNREFQMFLQFIVGCEDGRIIGAEAISRWDHPQKGLLYPGSYIEMMETEGTIAELDFYIFEEACRQLERWQADGQDLIISCNFARITIGQERFARRIQEIAGRYRFDCSKMILEITEDAMERSKETAFENISRCRGLGFRIALDDAGSGYTSFSDLRDYPIDIVKIDRSILNATVTQRGAALLKGMIALVHSLGMAALCEGAETQTQVAILRNVDCDYIQGHYFYRPLPPAEAALILKERRG